MIRIAPLLLAAISTVTVLATTAEAEQPPRIEVCFVLDTTGSMGGLIEGAKAKIWSIANQMIEAKPTPRLSIALVGYRDRGDDYITTVFDLTEDIDAVYANLHGFQADGGGDTPESVNQALHEAVTDISWSQDRDILKIIFLVGDCPPHMDYSDDVKYPETCQAAVRKDLIINTVQCGSHEPTVPIWQEIARLAEGSYVAIGQTGDMQVITTPFDSRLSELNASLGTTVVAYGRDEVKRSVRAKQMAAEAAPAPTMADRLVYNAKTGMVVQGGGDLVKDLDDGTVKLEELAEDELPDELRELGAAEREQVIKEKAAQRQQIQTEINDLLKKRQGFIDAETARLAREGKGLAFDVKVNEMLREQALRKGLTYESESSSGGTE
ncbi:VWA domain-containing protein [Candidatus Fermentibacteria bacterium]|nr:VWA domain-containing protein [Candidatus Fermentibacteria bacterium]